MKHLKLTKVVIISLLLLLIGCKTQKQNKEDVTPVVQTPTELPCQNFAQDDEEYYREFGFSSPIYSMQLARKEAVNNARNLMKQRLFGDVESSFYLSYEIECQKVSIDPSGMCIAYVVIKSPKNNK